MKRLALYIYIILCAAVGASAQTIVQQADSAYTREDYRQAIRLYQQAIADEGVSAEIYYNLGNAYYRIDNIGRAVLCYRRALNIDPSMRDARANLDFVTSKIIDKPEDDSSFLTNMHRNITAWMSPDGWAWTALVLFALFLACIGLYLLADRVTLRKAGFFGGVAALALTIYVSTIAWATARAYAHNNAAVVITDGAKLLSAPGSQSTEQARESEIGQGSVVEITDSTTIPGDDASPKWYNVKINNSTRAWINASNVERI